MRTAPPRVLCHAADDVGHEQIAESAAPTVTHWCIALSKVAAPGTALMRAALALCSVRCQRRRGTAVSPTIIAPARRAMVSQLRLSPRRPAG